MWKGERRGYWGAFSHLGPVGSSVFQHPTPQLSAYTPSVTAHMAEADYRSQTAHCHACDGLIWLMSGSRKAADAVAWMAGQNERLCWLSNVVGSKITNSSDFNYAYKPLELLSYEWYESIIPPSSGIHSKLSELRATLSQNNC